MIKYNIYGYGIYIIDHLGMIHPAETNLWFLSLNDIITHHHHHHINIKNLASYHQHEYIYTLAS